MDESVDLLVREWAVRTPTATAVSAGDAQYSFVELVRQADRFSRALRAAGVGPEVPVALCLPRSAALIVAALGVLGAGGAYVALDPTHPRARLQAIVTESGARAVVADRVDLGLPAGVGLIRPADLTAVGAQSATDPIDSGTRPHDEQAAYVIYTSGSTGGPKGVLVGHSALRHLVDWHGRTFELTRNDRVAQLASPGFDACVWDIWATLSAGASLHVPDETTRVTPVALRDWLLRERITVAFVPTKLAESLLALPWPSTAALRTLLTGGDALHQRPHNGLPFTLVNNYGLSEAAVVSTSGTVSPDDTAAPSIGTPVDHADAYIVDGSLKPVTVGEQGQLLLGGAGLARGYVGLPALTAQRFIADHLSGRPGGRLLCTGDLARQRPNGEIEFLGRADDQISRLGVRVEPAEIAAVLTRYPAVRSAVVVVESGDGPTQRLLAYLVADGDRPAAATLDDFAGVTLPAEMIPNQYVWLDELPVNGNGKVDRAQLPPPTDPSGGPTAPVGRAAGGNLETALVPVVAGVLGLPTIPVDANFFRLGGHSLLGAQLMLRLRDQYAVDLSLQFLFAHPTVEKMAMGIEALLLDELNTTSDADTAEHLGQVRR